MSTLLPALAVAFAAFCVWLTVRIVNRKERWAIWLAIVIVAYPLSGAALAWLAPNWASSVIDVFYWPFVRQVE